MSHILNGEEKREISENMIALSQEIFTTIESSSVNLQHLMRLIGSGVAQNLVAQAIQLNGGSMPELPDV